MYNTRLIFVKRGNLVWMLWVPGALTSIFFTPPVIIKNRFHPASISTVLGLSVKLSFFGHYFGQEMFYARRRTWTSFNTFHFLNQACLAIIHPPTPGDKTQQNIDWGNLTAATTGFRIHEINVKLSHCRPEPLSLARAVKLTWKCIVCLYTSFAAELILKWVWGFRKSQDWSANISGRY